MRPRIWLFSAGWLLCALTAQAQHWKFQMYGADLGLTNPTILALHQDHQGFLWVSTEGGLFRYDGDRFRAFRAYPGARTGYTGRNENFVLVWRKSSGGLQADSTEKFVEIICDVLIEPVQ